LAITKQLVDLLHGKIDVQSSLGLGSLFSIFLPAEVADGCSSEDNIGGHERGAGEGGGGGGGGGRDGKGLPPVRELKILSVEDILVNQIVLGGMLQQDGHRVVFVETGTAALASIDSSFDLILLDLQLPDMHGIDVLKTLRKHADPLLASMPIVVVSALVLDREKKECALAGADGFITKPVKLNLLRKEIRGLWDSGRLRNSGEGGREGEEEEEEEEEEKEEEEEEGKEGGEEVVVEGKEGVVSDGAR
jgi:CheY-like chemotaxis protein